MAKDRYERKHRRTAKHPACMAVMANAKFGAAGESLSEAMGLEDDMSKPTAGPWKVGTSDHGARAVLPARHGQMMPDGYQYRPVPVAQVPDGAGRSTAEADANARLIAAAPDLLAACKEMWSTYVEEHLLRSEVGLGDEEIGLAKARAEQRLAAAIAMAEARP